VKVLILHQHFNSPAKGGPLRSYYLAKALVDKGISVHVISGSNSSEGSEQIEGVLITHLRINYENQYGFFARSWAFLKYVFGVIRASNKFKDSDYCYAISTPLTVGLAAQYLKWRYNIPYFFEVGDLWPEAPIQMGFVKNYFLKKSLFKLEHSIYQSSKAIVALSPEILNSIKKRVPSKEVQLIPNMADCDFFNMVGEGTGDNLKNREGARNKFVISYIGAIGLANGLDYLIECANTSREANLPIHFIICGDGALLNRLKENVKKLGLPNLSFKEFTNRNGVRELLNASDASFICYKPIPVLETGSPHKYFDALASGKLVIINFGGWIKKEIEENKCGVYVNPFDPSDFIEKIQPFISDKELLKKYQQSSRKLGEDKYSRRELSEKFTQLFQ
jgi:glycosyltransferase involved in cell wall biosynthesis